MGTFILSQTVILEQTKKHKWAYAYKEPTEQKAICVRCGTERLKSKVGSKNCTRYITASGEVYDIHFGDKAPECR